MKLIGKPKLLSLFLCIAMLISSIAPTSAVAFAVGDTVTITVNFVYANNHAMVSQPYSANIPKGEAFHKEIAAPTLLNYSVPLDKAVGLVDTSIIYTEDGDGKGTVTFDLDSVQQDITVTLYYVAGSAQYTVKHYYQNLNDDDYGEPTVVELTGDIDAYTQAAMEDKPGFVCTGVPQYTIAADGTTVVEIYYDREYYTVVFDVNGGINGPPPIYGKYGTVVDIEQYLKEENWPTRAGYTFAGWSPEIEGTITHAVTYQAQWLPISDQADYTIVLWGQNANDNEYSYLRSYSAFGKPGDTATWNENTLICKGGHIHSEACYRLTCEKEEHTHSDACLRCGFSEHTHTTSCYRGVGSEWTGSKWGFPDNPTEGQTYTGYLNSYIYINGKWYTFANRNTQPELICNQQAHAHNESCYSCGLAAHTHTDACRELTCGFENDGHVHNSSCYMGSLAPDSNLWYYQRCEEVVINADGNTVLNVYFNRVVKTLHFRAANSNTDTYGTIQARWGANIADEYQKKVTAAGSSFWSENRNANSPWTNYIGVMPDADKTYYSHKTSGNSTSTMYYYVEALPGETGEVRSNGKWYNKVFDISFKGSGYTVTDEDHYEFEGFTYSHGTANGSDCNGAKFYYNRNQYTLDFYSGSNSTPDKSVTPAYQQLLAGFDYLPTTKPNTVENDAIFIGWYQNPECTGEEFDLASHTMPANNIALYAKWVNGLFTVKTYTDEHLQTLYTYEGYTGIQENIEKYTLASAPADPIKEGEVFVGWFYKDANGTEQPFSFTMPITQNYDLYPKFSNKVMITYTVHYYLEGTTTKVADDRIASAMIGTTITERAKMGTELNLVTDVTGYFPNVTSTSVVLRAQNQEILFFYREATAVQYTVQYVDANGNELLPSETKTTGSSIVTETYKPIENYSARQYQITQELSSDESKNIITFIYDPNSTRLTITKSGVQNLDVNQTFLFHVVGSEDKTKGVDMTVTIHGNGQVTIVDLPVGSYTVTEQTDWSWRYNPRESSQTKVLSVNAAENIIEFVNDRTKIKWLDGDNYKLNLFTGSR